MAMMRKFFLVLVCVCVCVCVCVYLLYYRKAPSRMLFNSFFYFLTA